VCSPRLDTLAGVSAASPNPASLAFPRGLSRPLRPDGSDGPGGHCGMELVQFALRHWWSLLLVLWAGLVGHGQPWAPRRTRRSGRRVRGWSWPARGALGLGAGQAGPPRAEALDDPLAVHDPVPTGHRAAASGLHRSDRLQPRSR